VKIVIGLYYYYPYISGLSVYARRLGEALTQHGHEVTIVASRHDAALEKEEVVNGVRVRRVPVWFRLDKGPIMPGFVPTILRLGRDADVINLHLPMVEAAAVARLAPRKTVITYHCDVRLARRDRAAPLIEWAIVFAMRSAIRRARCAVTTSFDYAANSKVLNSFLEKIVVIPPPIPPPDTAGAARIDPEYFRQRAQIPEGTKTIGFVGRIVYEKGLDFLIHAFFALHKQRDDVYLVIAGDYQDVAGGSVKSTLMRYLSGRDEHIRFIGRISDAELDAFYRFIDVLALPSIDPLEAYGMVQVEAMLRGTPVVATDLPGVRTVVQRTGMGLIVPRRDAHALGIALDRVLREHPWTRRQPDEIVHLLDLGDTTQMYADLFRKITNDEPI
jgi:glycosyltransferase involved in cell wall biosynthesis